MKINSVRLDYDLLDPVEIDPVGSCVFISCGVRSCEVFASGEV